MVQLSWMSKTESVVEGQSAQAPGSQVQPSEEQVSSSVPPHPPQGVAWVCWGTQTEQPVEVPLAVAAAALLVPGPAVVPPPDEEPAVEAVDALLAVEPRPPALDVCEPLTPDPPAVDRAEPPLVERPRPEVPDAAPVSDLELEAPDSPFEADALSGGGRQPTPRLRQARPITIRFEDRQPSTAG